MADSPQRNFVPVPGGKLYYDKAGTGPGLVLIHSAFLDSRLWQPQMATFDRHHTVVRYDIRGHGQSTGDRAGASDAEDLTALLNALEIRQAFLVGNSDGARIAAEFAAGFPDRTNGLVLVAGNPRDLEPTKEEEARFMDNFEDREGALVRLIDAGDREKALDQILDLWATSAPPEGRERLRPIANDNYDRFVRFLRQREPEGRPPAYPVAARLEAGSTPILSMAGVHDEPAMSMMMGRFAAKVPSAHYVELAEGDHTPSVSVPAEFESHVLDFLATVEGGGKWPPPKA